MANTAQPFRQHQITRAIRAAQAAGVSNPTIEVCLKNGTKIVIGGGKPDEIVAVGKGAKPAVRPTQDSRRGRR